MSGLPMALQKFERLPGQDKANSIQENAREIQAHHPGILLMISFE
jgi:hypothetical protein